MAGSQASLEACVRSALENAGLEDARIVWQADGRFEASGQAWASVVVKGLGVEPLWIKLPATARGATVGAAQAPEVAIEVAIDAFDAEVLAEGRAFVASLLAQGAIGGAGGPRRGPRGPTHELATDTQGRRVLRRRGFG